MAYFPKKLIGLEMEFGNHLVNNQTAEPAKANRLEPAVILWEGYRKLFGLGRDCKSGCKEGLDEFGTPAFRCYVDHKHFEVSTPLATDAKDLVMWQRAAIKLARRCKEEAGIQHNEIAVHCASTNRFGAAWGFHVNVLVSRQAFNKWRDRSWHPLLKQWVPFIVTSPVLFGTGKVGSENSRPRVDYQLSQRADFVDRVVGYETVLSKSLINERDEPLADPHKYARFHITAAYDCNLCDYASWLKFGTTQLMMAFIEANIDLPDLRLKDPLDSLSRTSQDLRMSAPLALENGTYYTALDIQETLAFAASRQVNRGMVGDETVPSAQRITNAWLNTITQLRRKDAILKRRLDWSAKRYGLEKLQQRLGISWDDPRSIEFDLRYGQIDGGWFEMLESKGLVDRLEDFLPLAHIGNQPYCSCRDILRKQIIEKFGGNVVAVGWDFICVNICNKTENRTYKIHLPEPYALTEILYVVRAARTTKQLIKLLPTSYCEKVRCSGIPK